jgi:hypothetical protein
MPRYNFREFMEFLPKGLNPFKIQSDFELEFLLNFIIQNLGRIGSWAKRMFVCFEIIHQLAKFGNFWS